MYPGGSSPFSEICQKLNKQLRDSYIVSVGRWALDSMKIKPTPSVMVLFYYIQSNFLNQLQTFTFKENIA